MTLDIAGVLRDAWVMAKRDRDVLFGVGGFFLFLPNLLQVLFVPPWPPLPTTQDQAAADLWIQQFVAWGQKYELLALAIGMVSLFGVLALFLLYVDRGRPVVATALGHALALLPYYLLLTFAATLPITLGYLILVLPGLYLKGRLLPVSPVFVAERPIGVAAAWRRSFALTRGNGFILTGLACVPLLGGWVLALPFQSIGQAMDGAPMANPVVAAVLDAGTSAAYTIATVAAILLEVALYRRLNKGM